MKRIAIITDATSEGYLFPQWLGYYGGFFGPHNLHVITYRALGSRFAGFGLADVIELDSAYDDDLRSRVISERVAALLASHDVVIRCDVDEFLVADPRKHASLTAYVEGLSLPYVTAVGLDVVETSDDAPLDLDRPVLGQRHWCVKSASLNKTALITGTASPPIRWAPGFHAATVSPRFDDLFLLHMKFADVQGRIAWFAAMREQVKAGSREYDYYDEGRAKLESFAAWINSRPRDEPGEVLDDPGFARKFLSTVTCNPANGIWQGEFYVDDVLIRCSQLFR